MSTPETSRKKWISWLMVGLGVILSVNLSRGGWGLFKAQDRIKEAEEKVAQLEMEKRELEVQVKYQLSEGYAEKEIRDKLSMAKPGEVVVILPEQNQPQATSDTLQAVQANTEMPDTQPNWRKWLKVFGF